MSLRLRPEEIERIAGEGRASYPNECCGFLLGSEVDGHKRVREVRPAENARGDSPQNRYLIRPEEFLRVTRAAEERQLEVLGFYHSHPDVEARPSAFDRDHAWPGYSYVIVSVRGGRPQETRSWVLHEESREFVEEELSVLEGDGTIEPEGVA